MSIANTAINQSSVTPSDPEHNQQVNPPNTSNLKESGGAVDSAASPKPRAFQPPAWTVPQSPRSLQQGVGSDSKIPKTPEASAVLTSTPPKLVARPSQDDSSSMTRTRSGSSPASLSSPSAGLAQTLATQTAVVPPLQTGRSLQCDTRQLIQRSSRKREHPVESTAIDPDQVQLTARIPARPAD
jgi:hypothetical protein